MSKEAQICKTFNDTIIEIKFILFPRRNYFKENIQPMIDFIKAMIPSSGREYNPNTNKWSVGAEYWPVLSKAMEAAGFRLKEVAATSINDIPHVHVSEEYAQNFHYKQESLTTQESATSIAEQLSKFLGVQIIAQDLNDLKKLYRAKALELHPDRGGDASKMSELNRLWTLYCNTGVKQ